MMWNVSSSIRIAAVTGLALLGGLSGNASAQQQWSIATSSTGSSPYVTGSNIATALNRLQGQVVLSAQTSGGFNENLALVAQKKVDLGLGTSFHAADAYEGRGRYKEVQGREMFRNLRLLFPVTMDSWHMVVRADSGIRSIDDLKGKKVNLNVPASATRGINERVLAAAGVAVGDLRAFDIATKGSFDAIRDRVVDASGNILPKGAGILQQLATGVPIDLVPVPESVFEGVNKGFHGTLARTEIPAGTYPGQTKATPTFGIPAVLIVHKDASPELVYHFVKTYWDNIADLTKLDRTLGDVPLDLAAKGSTPPLHPGAARYFRERGVLR